MGFRYPNTPIYLQRYSYLYIYLFPSHPTPSHLHQIYLMREISTIHIFILFLFLIQMIGHTNWVLYVSWSPNGKKVASGGMDNGIRVWCPRTGKQLGAPLMGHKRYVTAIAWEPLHKYRIRSTKSIYIYLLSFQSCIYTHVLIIQPFPSIPLPSLFENRNAECSRLVSASKDGTVKIWDVKFGKCVFSLSSHTMCVTCVKWGGEGTIDLEKL